MGAGSVHVRGLFELAVLVDPFFDEDLFERSEVQALLNLPALYLQLAAQDVPRAADGAAEQLADGEEVGLLLVDDAAVGRDAHFAIGEGVERVDGLIAGDAGGEMHEYVYFGRRVVVHTAYLYLPFLYGFQDTVDERGRGLAVGKFGYGQRLAVYLDYLGAYFHGASALAIVVSGNVDAAPCLEVGVEAEVLAAQEGDGRIAYFAEVVGQNLGGEAHGYSLHALRQEKGELYGQRDGLFLASVVGKLPLRHLRVENHFEGKLREPRFYVPGRGGAVAGHDVSPVSLRVDEQVLLPELHERVAYRGVAMGMELHGAAHYVGHLVVSAVVQLLHRVEYAALHGFEPVGAVRHRTFQDYIGGIVQKPIAVHAVQAEYLLPSRQRLFLRGGAVGRVFLGAFLFLFHGCCSLTVVQKPGKYSVFPRNAQRFPALPLRKKAKDTALREKSAASFRKKSCRFRPKALHLFSPLSAAKGRAIRRKEVSLQPDTENNQ